MSNSHSPSSLPPFLSQAKSPSPSSIPTYSRDVWGLGHFILTILEDAELEGVYQIPLLFIPSSFSTTFPLPLTNCSSTYGRFLPVHQ